MISVCGMNKDGWLVALNEFTNTGYVQVDPNRGYIEGSLSCPVPQFYLVPGFYGFAGAEWRMILPDDKIVADVPAFT